MILAYQIKFNDVILPKTKIITLTFFLKVDILKMYLKNIYLKKIVSVVFLKKKISYIRFLRVKSNNL